MSSTADIGVGEARPVLYTTPIIAICAIAFLGFASNFVIQPILPILIVERGGDATLVGLVIAAFSLPSVVSRPYMGRLVDEWSNRLVLAGGMLIIAVAGVVYLAPSLAAIFVNRIVHGGAWAAFNTAGHSMLARLAPPERRGEASGIYNLMPGLAQMVLPSVGLLLLAWFGMAAPFLACAVFGVLALVIVLAGPFRGELLAPVPRTTRTAAAWGLLESGAVLPMLLELLFSLVFSLFLVFPPLFAASRGIPVGDLAIYYPIYGGTLVVVRAASGRFLDRAPRRRVVTLGTVLAIAGLAISALAETIAILTLGAAVYATAAAFTSPTLMALAIDRADPQRLGAAMATYTLGFQLAIGAGAALWGVVIDAFGYPAPYIAGIAVQVALLGILTACRGSLGAARPGPVA